MYLSVENVLYFETCPRVLVTWNVFYSLEHVQLSVTVPCSRNCSDLKKKNLFPSLEHGSFIAKTMFDSRPLAPFSGPCFRQTAFFISYELIQAINKKLCNFCFFFRQSYFYVVKCLGGVESSSFLLMYIVHTSSPPSPIFYRKSSGLFSLCFLR